MSQTTAELELDRPRRAGTLLAVVVLVGCCLLWGFSFPAMQVATTRLDRCRPAGDTALLASRALFNAIRFGLAAMLYYMLTFRRQRGFGRADVVGGASVGLFFTLGMFLQVLGLRWTLPSVSGFLTSMAVVFAPLAQARYLCRRVGGATWGAVGLALAGALFLSLPNPAASTPLTLASSPPLPLLGELLTVVAAMIFTLQILAVDRFGPRAHVVRLTFLMLATTSLASLAISVVISPQLIVQMNWLALSGDWVFGVTLAALVVFSSVVALHLMNQFQPRVSPAAASIVYCTEPIFATLFSIAWGTETGSGLTLAGGIGVIAAVLLVAWSERKPQAGNR